MIKIERTDSSDSNFLKLVEGLDLELKERDGSDNAFYAQFNKVDLIKQVVVAFVGGEPAGCGAFKGYDANTVEIKRMYVAPHFRKKGVARAILAELEQWGTDSGFGVAVLETGKRQPEAIQLYLSCGFKQIPNYGQYAGIENSVCMKKTF